MGHSHVARFASAREMRDAGCLQDFPPFLIQCLRLDQVFLPGLNVPTRMQQVNLIAKDHV
jgi:hypothetical protein